MAHPAVRPVAADHVGGADLGLVARDVAERRLDDLAVLGEANQLDALLDRAAELGYAGPKEPFGLVLRKVEDEAVPGAVAGHVEVEQASPAGVHAEPTHLVAMRDEGLRQPHGVQELERACVDADRAALRGRNRGLVDDPGPDAAGEQLRCEDQAGRTCADDQHLALRTECLRCVHGSNDGRPRRPNRQKNYVGATYFAPARPSS